MAVRTNVDNIEGTYFITFTCQYWLPLFEITIVTIRYINALIILKQKVIIQKLSYMHNNPCSGAWRLVESPVDYKHSSAKFYNTGEQGVYLIADQ